MKYTIIAAIALMPSAVLAMQTTQPKPVPNPLIAEYNSANALYVFPVTGGRNAADQALRAQTADDAAQLEAARLRAQNAALSGDRAGLNAAKSDMKAVTDRVCPKLPGCMDDYRRRGG